MASLPAPDEAAAAAAEAEAERKKEKRNRKKDKDGLVQLHRKGSYALAKKDKKSKGDKLAVQMLDNDSDKAGGGSSSMGTVLMQRDKTGALSAAMAAEIDKLRAAIEKTPGIPYYYVIM